MQLSIQCATACSSSYVLGRQRAMFLHAAGDILRTQLQRRLQLPMTSAPPAVGDLLLTAREALIPGLAGGMGAGVLYAELLQEGLDNLVNAQRALLAAAPVVPRQVSP